MRRICVLNATLDLAAGGLSIGSGDGGKLNGGQDGHVILREGQGLWLCIAWGGGGNLRGGQDGQVMLEEDQGLCCVTFSVYCHAASAPNFRIRLSCVWNTALNLAAAALCTEGGVAESKCGYIVVRLRTRCAGVGPRAVH
ncbi:hypothetical protein EAH_00065400 [Eimeria acervulina]|uniref:Uncharacterized protein n=1 Tax=Eimeria acervulina TaxID=5801 RepID=U6GSF2_EIMAC|nr:hypothetical protein EAH_00065400 [Eimeria acervulina]CDI82208.1 hypothetical protein EAH_00065400 [Eimeria acervulina]